MQRHEVPGNSTEEEKIALWIKRTMSIQRGDPLGAISEELLPAARKIVQYHFTNWKDQKPPQWPELQPFLQLIRGEKQDTAPIVVHCSAGVGRTGTLIVVDRLMKQRGYKSEFDLRGKNFVSSFS